MATAEQYAQWIVDNADKKGTEEFDIVSKAYTEAKALHQEPAKMEPMETPDTGFTGALKAVARRLYGEAALTGEKIGLLGKGKGQEIYEEQEAAAQQIGRAHV